MDPADGFFYINSQTRDKTNVLDCDGFYIGVSDILSSRFSYLGFWLCPEIVLKILKKKDVVLLLLYIVLINNIFLAIWVSFSCNYVTQCRT